LMLRIERASDGAVVEPAAFLAAPPAAPSRAVSRAAQARHQARNWPDADRQPPRRLAAGLLPAGSA
jgi:hypothetical protein